MRFPALITKLPTTLVLLSPFRAIDLSATNSFAKLSILFFVGFAIFFVGFAIFFVGFAIHGRAATILRGRTGHVDSGRAWLAAPQPGTATFPHRSAAQA
jgi:hypothetical protein